MVKTTSLGDRMKGLYEQPAKTRLVGRTNMLIRLDGVGFSKFTKGLDKPYDASFVNAMNQTAASLCKAIQGAKCAFVQSDEITILVTDYDNNSTNAWFDGNVQKIVSVAAGMATAYFNQVFKHKTRATPGFFDARVFTIPFAEEVVNCFLWRQQDCTRNSVSMLAQNLYPHKELHGKDINVMQEMIYQKSEELRVMLIKANILPKELHNKLNLNWNDLPSGLKRGRFITRKTQCFNDPINGEYTRNKWVAEGAPLFAIDRDSILSLLPGYIEGAAN